MKPVDFTLHRPDTVEEALQLLAEHGDDGKVLAGGQSLVPLLNFRLARPEHLIDISRIASLAQVTRRENSLHIGSMVRHAQAERSAAVAAAAPLVSAALPHIAHPAIRNRGSIGGSVAHGDPAAELPAVMRALDATLLVRNATAERRIPAAKFFHGNLMTALAPDELLVGIELTPAPTSTGAAFEEVGRRRGDFALVGAGVQLSLDTDGSVRSARIALTGVSAVPHRAESAESILIGGLADEGALARAAAAVRDEISPSSDLHATAAYRQDVAGELVVRAARTAYRLARRHQRAA